MLEFIWKYPNLQGEVVILSEAKNLFVLKKQRDSSVAKPALERMDGEILRPSSYSGLRMTREGLPQNDGEYPSKTLIPY